MIQFIGMILLVNLNSKIVQTLSKKWQPLKLKMGEKLGTAAARKVRLRFLLYILALGEQTKSFVNDDEWLFL